VDGLEFRIVPRRRDPVRARNLIAAGLTPLFNSRSDVTVSESNRARVQEILNHCAMAIAMLAG